MVFEAVKSGLPCLVFSLAVSCQMPLYHEKRGGVCFWLAHPESVEELTMHRKYDSGLERMLDRSRRN